MGVETLGDGLIRVAVAVAAMVFAVRLLNHSRKLVTAAVLGVGIALVLTSAAIPAMRQTMHWPPQTWWAAVLGRADAPGFALILLAVLRGLRGMRRAGEKLREQNRTLKEQASTDFLTGLLNRRQAEFLLEYGAARARQSRDPVGFLMIDLDHFKQVNDQYGHQAGDAVLAHVGQLLKARLSANDIVARYGGEEFLVVVAESDCDRIFELAEDLRRLIEQEPAAVGDLVLPITASIGVAVSRADSEQAAREAVGQADAALYAAKAAGRNRVIRWDTQSPRSRPVQCDPRFNQ